MKKFKLLVSASLLLWVPSKTRVAALGAAGQMRPGGISLRYNTFKIGPQRRPVLLHFYVVPNRRVGHKKEPINKEDIIAGSSIPKSPFFLDLFLHKNGKLQKLNSVRFVEDGAIRQVEVRWLQARARRVPVILLRFGVGDGGEWVSITFAKGLRDTPSIQTWGFSGDRDSSCFSRFDTLDSRGLMMIREDCSWYESGRRETHFYRWNGKRFQ